MDLGTSLWSRSSASLQQQASASRVHVARGVGLMSCFLAPVCAGVRLIHTGGPLLDEATLLAGLQVGLLAATLLAVNTARDAVTDAKARAQRSACSACGACLAFLLL